MSAPRILIAGIGNIFLGDDAFGVEVVRVLANRPLPEEVRVVDFGIRGFDLACALVENYELVLLVDAAPRGGPPGTVYLIEPTLSRNEQAGGGMSFEMHNLTPERVLGMAAALGGVRARVLVVGCEPSRFAESDASASDEPAEMDLGLSEPVRAAIDKAFSIIESLVAQTLGATKHGDDSFRGVTSGETTHEAIV